MKKAKMQAWPILVEVRYPSDHPDYPRCAIRIKAHIGAEVAQEAAETVLAIARANWPAEWNVEDFPERRPRGSGKGKG